MSELIAQEELWSKVWAEAAPLAALHSVEVDGGVEPRRKYEVDTDLMQAMETHGSLRVVTARTGGRLVGYFTWALSPDVESRGLLIAQQGAWFVLPGYPRAAVLMFDTSVKLLQSLGVGCIFPHHRLQGRGRSIGRFFRRRGAKEIQHTYCLWIGEN